VGRALLAEAVSADQGVVPLVLGATEKPNSTARALAADERAAIIDTTKVGRSQLT
jgi:hypothetical protein